MIIENIFNIIYIEFLFLLNKILNIVVNYEEGSRYI